MPTYDYGCKACGHEFQREQRISENPIKKCPECGKLQAKRLISRTSFVLKGGGWYSDLYSGPSNKSGGSSEDKPADSPGDKGSKSDGSEKSPAEVSATSDSKKPSESKAKSKAKQGKSKKAAA